MSPWCTISGGFVAAPHNRRIPPSRSLEVSTLHEETPGAGLEAVRRQNLSAILRRVHLAGPASRSDLANYMGLNRSTVGVLVAELAARGLVHERAGVRGVPGRPSPIVTANPNSKFNGCWLTIDVPIPPGYSAPQSGWWKIKYTMTGSGTSNDVTTWKVGIKGNPVHLITP